MSDSARTGDGAPNATAVVDDYFAQLTTVVAAVGAPVGPDELAELRTYVDERLSRTHRTAADATQVLAGLGSPQTLAQAFAEAEDEADADRPPQAKALVGRVLGIPYDIRPPTSDRFATRAWDPTDSRILVPKALGLGWTVNFGALAVKAHLVRPDDEDAPFAATPESAVKATLAAPIAVVVALGVLIAVRWSSLPATVPCTGASTARSTGTGPAAPRCSAWPRSPWFPRPWRVRVRAAASHVQPRRGVRREPRARRDRTDDRREDAVRRGRGIGASGRPGSGSRDSWSCRCCCSSWCPAWSCR